MTLTVHIVQDAAELPALCGAWHERLACTSAPTFFHTPEWLETYWRHFGRGQQLRLAVVRQADVITALVPLVLRRTRTWLGPVRQLSYPLDYWGSFYGPIGSDPAAALRAVLPQLLTARRDWELLDLRWVAADPHGAGTTAQALDNSGLRVAAQPHALVPLIDLRMGWESFWQSRKGHFRREIQRAERKLLQRGSLRIEHLVADPGTEPDWRAFEHCLHITARSHHARAGHGVGMTHPRAAAFFRDLHAVAWRLGAAEINLLYLDDRPLAFNYGLNWQGYVSGLRMAFDAAVPEGAGQVLLAHTLAESVRRGQHTFDLGPDYLAYKRAWQTHTQTTWRYTYYPLASPTAQALAWGRWLRERIERPPSAAATG